MPYALALGVEQAWSEQFHGILAASSYAPYEREYDVDGQNFGDDGVFFNGQYMTQIITESSASPDTYGDGGDSGGDGGGD